MIKSYGYYLILKIMHTYFKFKLIMFEIVETLYQVDKIRLGRTSTVFYMYV